jgi:flavin reductase (DIM6/NTAB) family NADH-FMN oxidoreductase RutF
MSQIDSKALFKIGYGLYLVTCRDTMNDRDNALILNSVMQVTNNPDRLAVCINKANYSHDLIKDSGIMNVLCLTESAPFSLFEHYGMQSGKTTDKLRGVAMTRSCNGLPLPTEHVNAYFVLQVESYTDLGSHGMFICTIIESATLSNEPSMTYAYYHANVKPKPAATTAAKAKGYVCKICGYVYEGDELPEDFVCPWCKHGAADFEPINPTP